MYEDEIPKELVKGNTYSGQELKFYLQNNKKEVLLSDGMLMEHIDYVVEDIIHKHLLTFNNRTYNFDYGTNDNKRIILLAKTE